MGKVKELNISLELSEFKGRVEKIVPSANLSRKGTTLEVIVDRSSLNGIKAIQNKNFFKFHSVLNCDLGDGEKITLIQRDKAKIKVTGKNGNDLINFLQMLCSFKSTQSLKFSW